MNKLLIVLLLLLGSISKAQIIKARPNDWQQLFNKKNLSGWHPKITNYDLDDNFANTFRVKYGLLSVRYDGYDGLVIFFSKINFLII